MSDGFDKVIEEVFRKNNEGGIVADAGSAVSPADLVWLYRTLTNGAEKELRRGMLAVWKPGLKNRKFPEYGEPVVVVEMYPPELLTDEEPDSQYFREPSDLAFGVVLGKNCDFCVFHADSRRFMPAPQ